MKLNNIGNYYGLFYMYILSFLNSDDEIDHYGNPIINQAMVCNPGGITVVAPEMSSLR